MYRFFRRKRDDIITSPVVGKSIALDKVSDAVFSNRLLGDGMAFIFDGDTVYSPCKGKIIMIADTKHAFGIRTENGAEILLHIGMDTVNLNGKGFIVLTENNADINAGEPLLKIDREVMAEAGIDLTMPLVVTNTGDYELELTEERAVDLNSVVLKIKKK